MIFKKPNETEKTIIIILCSIAFGFFIGVLSMKKKLEDFKSMQKVLVVHLEELTEINEHLIRDRQ